MEEYLKAVSGMYSQFKKVEVHPMVEYIGRRTSTVMCRRPISVASTEV